MEGLSQGYPEKEHVFLGSVHGLSQIRAIWGPVWGNESSPVQLCPLAGAHRLAKFLFLNLHQICLLVTMVEPFNSLYSHFVFPTRVCFSLGCPDILVSCFPGMVTQGQKGDAGFSLHPQSLRCAASVCWETPAIHSESTVWREGVRGFLGWAIW